MLARVITRSFARSKSVETLMHLWLNSCLINSHVYRWGTTDKISLKAHICIIEVLTVTNTL